MNSCNIDYVTELAFIPESILVLMFQKNSATIFENPGQENIPEVIVMRNRVKTKWRDNIFTISIYALQNNSPPEKKQKPN